MASAAAFLMAVVAAAPFTIRAGEPGVVPLEPLGAADPADLGLDFDMDLAGFDLEGELALLAAEDIVVSATRHAQRIEESPSAITVITREEIQRSGIHDLVDLMNRVPGSDVYRVNQGQATIGLRSGTTQSGDLLLVLVDGRDAALHLLGQPQWLTMQFDLDSIERIEIIRGPGSTLYGANALQGVINIVTRQPSREPYVGEGTVQAAGLNTIHANARVHGSHGALGYWASAGYERRAPYEDPGQRDAQLFRGRVRGDWRPDDDRHGVLELGYVETDGILHTALGSGHAGYRWPYLLGRLRLGQTELQLVADQTDTAFQFDAAFAMPQDDGPPQVLVTVPAIEHPTRSLELGAQHALEPLPGHRLTLGAQARLIQHRAGTFVRCEDPGRPADFTPDLCETATHLEARGGVYVQDEWRIVDNLTLTTGLRLDASSLTRQPGFSPRAAAVWLPVQDHALRLSAGRAYRKPTFAESHGHFLLERGGDDVPEDLLRRLQYALALGGGNPDLVNETSTALELGWRGRFLDGMAIVTTDLFWQRRDHAIYMSAETFQLEPGFGGAPSLRDDAKISYVNRPHPSWSYGGEATVTLRPSRRAHVSASYAHDRIFFREEDESGAIVDVPGDGEAVHQIGLAARFELLTGLSLTIDGRWDSAYRKSVANPESIMLPAIEETLGAGAPLLGSSLRYRHAIDRGEIEFGLVAFNVLDTRVRQIAGVDQEDGPYGAERLARRVSVFVRGRY
jgi:iron complex outermembrane recepter protein